MTPDFLSETWAGLARDGIWLMTGLLLQSSLVLAVGLAAARVLRRRGPLAQSLLQRATLCALAGGVLLSLGAARHVPAAWRFVPLGASAFSATPLHRQPQGLGAHASFTPLLGPPSESIAAVESAAASPAATSRVAKATQRSAGKQPQASAAPSPWPRLMPTRPVLTIVQVNWLFLSAALTGLWLAGSMAGLSWLVFCYFHLARLRRHCRTLHEGGISAMLQRLSASRGLRPPMLLHSNQIRAPFLCGVWRPAIMLPAAAETWDAETCRAILLHELAHLKRNDLRWMLAVRLVRTLLWPQPLLWLLCRRMEEINEEVCDAAVLEGGCAPRRYALCLLDLAESWMPASQRVAAAGVVPFRSVLSRRVQLILENRRNIMPVSKTVRCAVVLGTLAVVAASPLLFSTEAAPQAAARAEVVATPSVDLSSPEATVRSFVAALEKGDARRAMACISGITGINSTRLTEDQQHQLRFGPQNIRNLRVQSHGDVAKVDLYSNGNRLPERLRLQREEAKWRILPASDNEAYPARSTRFGDLRFNAANLASPIFARNNARNMECLLRLRNLSLAAMVFAAKHNGKFAFEASAFADKLLPLTITQRTHPDQRIELRCPHDEGHQISYSFNPHLEGLSLARIARPAETVMFYEGSDGRLNFRHPVPYASKRHMALIGYADGHVRGVTPETAKRLIWKPALLSVKAAQARARERERVFIKRMDWEKRQAAAPRPVDQSSKTPNLRQIAGLTALSGPGVVLHLQDRKVANKGSAGPLLTAGVVHDYDLLHVVNELQAAQAEGIAVNGVRLTGYTPIRCVGPTIYVGSQGIQHPYRVAAIGNPGALVKALSTRGGLLDSFRAVGPAVRLVRAAQMRLPAATRAPAFRFGKPQ